MYYKFLMITTQENMSVSQCTLVMSTHPSTMEVTFYQDSPVSDTRVYNKVVMDATGGHLMTSTHGNGIWYGTRNVQADPTMTPSAAPTTVHPTVAPTIVPTAKPFSPSSQPTSAPTHQPSGQPVSAPSAQPSRQPSNQPTAQPSGPSSQPTQQPSGQPTRTPISQPSSQPSVVPTTQPSSVPTSAPSCTAGRTLNGVACELCPAGFYSPVWSDGCLACPKGFYSSEEGSIECTKCTAPFTSVREAQSSCEAMNLNMGTLGASTILCGLFAIMIMCIVAGENRIALALNLVYPTLDVFSDLAYLMTNDFYSPILFALGVFFVLFPIPFFIMTLIEVGALFPRLWLPYESVWWLKADCGEDRIYFAKFPCFGETGRFPVLSRKKHYTLLLVFLELLVWIIAIASQIMTIALFCVLIPVNVMFLLFWLLLGMFFHMTKMITLGVVWNTWFRVWTGSNHHDTDVDIDTEEMNKCLQHEFYFETMPQVVLQIINNVYLGQLSPIAIASLAQSGYTACNGCWKFIYYRFMLNDGVDLKDVPIDKSIAINLKWFGIKWVFVDAKLEPKAKSKRFAKKHQIVPASIEEPPATPEQSPEIEPAVVEMVPIEHHLCVTVDRDSKYCPIAQLEEGRYQDPGHATTAVYAVATLSDDPNFMLTDDAASFESFLTGQLVKQGTSLTQAEQCFTALKSEGVTSQEIWALLTERKFNDEFLSDIGIRGVGLQQFLIALHRKLRAELRV